MRLIALLISAVLSLAPASAQFFQHDEGVSYEMISKCLSDEFGFDEGRHYRKGREGKVQFNSYNLQGDSLAKFIPETGRCWKKPEVTRKAPSKRS